MQRDDFDLRLTGRRLVVRAERKMAEPKGLLRRGTRTTGRYFLELVLADEVDPEGVEAPSSMGC